MLQWVCGWMFVCFFDVGEVSGNHYGFVQRVPSLFSEPDNTVSMPLWWSRTKVSIF